MHKRATYKPPVADSYLFSHLTRGEKLGVRILRLFRWIDYLLPPARK